MKGIFLCFILWTLVQCSKASDDVPCALKDVGEGNKVCVCSATFCDTIHRVTSLNKGEFVSFTSSKEGLRFKKTTGKLSQTSQTNNRKESNSSVFSQVLSLSSIPELEPKSITFTIDSSKKYQKIMGFGGAFTDSAGINILSLGKETQEHLLRSYFSEHGIEYNLCRVPIGGTDFSTHTYSYDDGSVDPHLTNFSLAKEDLKYKIPLIKRAVEISERNINLVAAAWSPPPWMKTNQDFSGLSFLKSEYYHSYAKYLIRFLDEYKNHNISVWAISTGNEPSNGLLPVNRFNSLGWTPLGASNWTVHYFGPSLRSSTHNKTLILAFDDQRLFLPWWIDLMVSSDKDVLKYIDGFAIHWYWDFMVGVGAINKLHNKHPDKFILYTEASVGDKPWEKKVDIGSWERGDKYLADIIENLNAMVTGWMDWNLALDLMGGPNWAKNYVDSPILVNASANEFYKQPMFYAMGHVSKFIERDAVRVEISPTDSSGVHATAVLNPDGRVVVVLLNKNTVKAMVAVNVVGKGWINIDLPPHSFVTILC